jgi:hypothetical protein
LDVAARPPAARKNTAPNPVITPTAIARIDSLASPIRGGNLSFIPIALAFTAAFSRTRSAAGSCSNTSIKQRAPGLLPPRARRSKSVVRIVVEIAPHKIEVRSVLPPPPFRMTPSPLRVALLVLAEQYAEPNARLAVAAIAELMKSDDLGRSVLSAGRNAHRDARRSRDGYGRRNQQQFRTHDLLWVRRPNLCGRKMAPLRLHARRLGKTNRITALSLLIFAPEILPHCKRSELMAQCRCLRYSRRRSRWGPQ